MAKDSTKKAKAPPLTMCYVISLDPEVPQVFIDPVMARDFDDAEVRLVKARDYATVEDVMTREQLSEWFTNLLATTPVEARVQLRSYKKETTGA